MTKYSAQERLILIRKLVEGEQAATEICRQAGISRTLFYRWLKRYRSVPTGEEETALQPRKRRVLFQKKQVSPVIERKILSVVRLHPEWSSKKISAYLGKNKRMRVLIGNHGVENVLRRLDLNTIDKRREFSRKHWRLPPLFRRRMLERVLEGKEKVTSVSRQYGLSRTAFYRWLKRWQEGGRYLSLLEDKIPRIKKYWRQTSESQVEIILKLVVKHPEYSSHKLARVLGWIGNHGVQNVLRRLNLNTYERRLVYAQSHRPLVQPAFGFFDQLRPVLAKLPVISAIPPPSFSRLSSLFRPFFASFFFSLIGFNLLAGWLRILTQASNPAHLLGLIFASLALAVGSFFFAYSMKYYLTIGIVLSFSRESGEITGHGEIGGSNGNGGFWRLVEKVFGLNGNSNGKAPYSTSNGNGMTGSGLQPNLDHIRLGRYPFFSIHLPFYNEKKVALRLIEACLNMDYPNGEDNRPAFEVVVCDDSTDETTAMIRNYQSRLGKIREYQGADGETIFLVEPKHGPTLKVIHRTTREGFKGKALSYALKHMDERTEFVAVFDADFVPYPDTLEQFLKYFKAAGGWEEKECYLAKGVAAMPYETFKEITLTPEEEAFFVRQAETLKKKSSTAVVAGYQWHVLNKSENWITRGVRAEYAGSYVVERPGQEILGALKIIHGSVYCIRADVLKHFGWGSSITEDYELTLRIYQQGFRVAYTPYIQAPSECVSTLKRLIRQRMRWAEGHSFNTRKMLGKLLFGYWQTVGANEEQNAFPLRAGEKENRSLLTRHFVPSPLTFMEKLEFLYLAPYYLQSAFFLVGTFAWLVSETVFHTSLPFWTSLWGWSLVLTNLFALPLVNAVGLFLEEAEEKDYLGLLSFIALSYLLVPFQAYAAAKGFIEEKEGPWFRTPKTGRITDIFTRGRFYRWLTDIFSWRPVTGGIAARRLREPAFRPAINPYLALASANNRFNLFRFQPKKWRGIANGAIIVLLAVSVVLNMAAMPLTTIMAFDGTFYFRDSAADLLSTSSGAPRKRMSTGDLGTATKTVTLGGGSTGLTYYFRDTADSWNPSPTTVTNATSSASVAFPNQRHILGRIQDSNNSLVSVQIASEGKIHWSYSADDGATWTDTNTNIYARTVSADMDSAFNLHVVYDVNGDNNIYYRKFTYSSGPSYSIGSAVTLETSATSKLGTPAIAVSPNSDNYIRTAYSVQTRSYSSVTGNGIAVYGDTTETTRPRFRDYTYSTDTWTAEANTEAANSTIRWVVVKANPKNANEFIAGTVSSTGPTLYIQRFDGTNWRSEWSAAVGSSTTQAFDIAYEQNTGNCLVVYSDGTANPKFRYWNGLYWTDAQSIGNSNITTGAVNWIKMASRPSSNEITAAYEDANGDLSAMVWSGEAWIWEPTAALETNLEYVSANGDARSFDLEYEQSSGDLLVVWGVYNTRGIDFATRAANSPTWTAGAIAFTGGDVATHIDLACEQGSSSRCAVASVSVRTDSNDFQAGIWDGSTWSQQSTNLDTSTVAPTAGTQMVGVGWAGTAAVAVFSDSDTGNEIDWALSSNGGAFSVQTDNTSVITPANPVNIEIYNVPGQNEIILAIGDSSTTADLDLAAYVSGTGWVSAGGNGLENDLAQNTYRCWYLAFDGQAVTQSPKVYYNQSTNGGSSFDGGTDITLNGESGKIAPSTFPSIVIDDGGSEDYVFVTWYSGDGEHYIRRGTGTTTISWGGSAWGSFSASSPATATSSAMMMHSAVIKNGGGEIGLVVPNTTALSAGDYRYKFEKSTTGATASFTEATGVNGTTAGDGYPSISEDASGSYYIFLKDNSTNIAYYTYNGSLSSKTTFYSTNTNSFPSAKENAVNGRVELLWTNTNSSSQTYYNYISLYHKISSNSQGSSVKSRSVGYNAYDYLYFNTSSTVGGTLDTASDVSVIFYTGAGYTANNEVKIRFEITNSSGTTVVDQSTEKTWSSASGGAGQRTQIFDCPSECPTTTDLTDRKIRVRFRDGGSTNIVPIEYDSASQNSSVTFYTTSAAGADTFYILTDNLNKRWTGGDKELPTEGTTSEQRNLDMVTDSSGYTYAVWEDERNSQSRGTWTVSGDMNSNHNTPGAILLNNGKALVIGDFSDDAKSIAELYDPVTGTWTNTGTVNYSRTDATYISLKNGKVLLLSGAAIMNIAELYDPLPGAWSVTGSLYYGRFYPSAVLLANGKVLVTGDENQGVGMSIAELYDPLTGTWSIAGTSRYGRGYNQATLLENGKVLVIGSGIIDSHGRSIAELYDPATGTFSIAGTTAYGRSWNNGVLLQNGRVLVIGDDGDDAPGPGYSIAELYDPATGTFSIAGTTAYGHNSHATTLLNNGKVLVIGNWGTNGDPTAGSSICEIYDPATGRFSTGGTLHYFRTGVISAPLLNDGRVLVAGSGERPDSSELYTPKTADIYSQKFDKNGTPQWNGGADIRVNSDDGNRTNGAPNYDHLNPRIKLDSSNNPVIVWQEARNSVYGDDIYAQKLSGSTGAKQWPAATTGTWSIAGTTSYAYTDGFSILLQNGKILLIGDANNGPGDTIASLYDPSTNSWSIAGTANYGRSDGTAVLLNNGKVLFHGSGVNSPGRTIAELYDPATSTFSITGTSTYPRFYLTSATLLQNGKVLAVGAFSDSGSSIAELYDPVTGTWSLAGTMSHLRSAPVGTLLGNGKVLMVGDGTYGGTIAEIYDPAANSWSVAGTTNYERSLANSILLNNGQVLILGGTEDLNSGISIAEIYNPATGIFSIAGTLSYPRVHRSSVLLPSGKVLVVDTGLDNPGRSIAEIYNPATGIFSIAGTMSYGRGNAMTKLLPNGRVLVAGGSSMFLGPGISIAEIYTPASDIQVSNDGSPVNGMGLPRPEYPVNGRGILGEQKNPVLAIDSSDNAVIAWEDNRFDAVANWGISFNHDANAWWQTERSTAATGKCNGGGRASNSCGAIPVINSLPSRIMGQKLSSAGVKQWGNNLPLINQNNPEDLGLSSTGDSSSRPSLTADGTSIIAAWESNGALGRGFDKKDYNIYSQKFNSSGVGQWGGTWAAGGTLSYARSSPAGVLINDGQVLLVGTGAANSGQTIAELYDSASSLWTVAATTSYIRTGSTGTLLNTGSVLLAGSGSGSGLTIAELYNPSAGTMTATGTLSYARTSSTATLIGNGRVLVVGTSQANSGTSIAELYNPATGTFSVSGTTAYSRNSHATTLLNNGKVLVIGTAAANSGRTIAEIYNPASATPWSIAGTTSYQRAGATATILHNGKVLVVGTTLSAPNNQGTSIAELYDPTTGTFSIAGTTSYGRISQTTSLLNNGKVLVYGSNGTSGSSIAELYDPTTGTFSIAGTTTYARYNDALILLNNGKLITVGDGGAGSGQTIAELFSTDRMVNSGADLADQRNPVVAKDPSSNYYYAWQGRKGSGQPGGTGNAAADHGGGSWKIYGMKTNSAGSSQWPSGTTGSWSVAGTLNYPRNQSGFALLNSGKVLIIGSESGAGQSVAELYDPAAGIFTVAGTSDYLYGHGNTATVLPNGRVLVAGGYFVSGSSIAEIYDPATGAFSSAGTMNYPRMWHSAVLLNNGRVLILGTEYTNEGKSIAELYDPVTNTWSITGTSNYSHDSLSLTIMNNGKVLVVGANVGGGSPGTSIAELYDPTTNTFSVAGTLSYPRQYHAAVLLDNGKVLVSGSNDGAGSSISEIYDPATSSFSIASTMSYYRSDVSLALMDNGKVLVVGGGSGAGVSISEIYDPVTSRWATTGTLSTNRVYSSVSLLPSGKILVMGTVTAGDPGQSIAEIYNPSGELALSHDFAQAGDQENPSIALDSSGNLYAAWEDNRNASASASFIRIPGGGDKNIFMQKFSSATGAPLWPAASTSTGYTSPYSVSDVRVDTYWGETGTQYSGRPVIGGIFADGTTATPIVIGWQDNRNSSDPMDIYAQSYDTAEYNIAQQSSSDWTVYFHASSPTSPNISVGVEIVEADGTTVVEKGMGTSQTWNTCSPACPSIQSLTWAHNGSPAPPSDQVGNITMRRLKVTFTRNSGGVVISYDNTGYESRLSTGTIVPERLIILAWLMPLVPPAIRIIKRRKKQPCRWDNDEENCFS